MTSFLNNTEVKIAKLKTMTPEDSFDYGFAVLDEIFGIKNAYKSNSAKITTDLLPEENLIMVILLAKKSPRLLEATLSALRAHSQHDSIGISIRLAGSAPDTVKNTVLSVIEASTEDWNLLGNYRDTKKQTAHILFFEHEPLGSAKISLIALERYGVVLPVPKPRQSKFI